MVRHRRQSLNVVFGQSFDAHLQREIRHQYRVVTIASAFSVTVDCSLHMRGAGKYTRHRIGNCATCVILGMHSNLDTIEVSYDVSNDSLNFVR